MLNCMFYIKLGGYGVPEINLIFNGYQGLMCGTVLVLSRIVAGKTQSEPSATPSLADSYK